MKPSAKSMFKAAVFFARLPFAEKMNRLPPRTHLMGGKRKIFDTGVFGLEAWKLASGRKKVGSKNYLLAESFLRYVSRMDDLLDQVNPPRVLSEKTGYYKKDMLSRQRIAGFVNRARAMKSSGKLSGEDFKKITKIVGDFRRTAWKAQEGFERVGKPGLAEVIALRESTSGLLGRTVSAILDVCERVPESERGLIELAFSDAFMGLQIADDIRDVREDFANRTPSIALGVLAQNPAEMEKVVGSGIPSVISFKRLAPKSYKLLLGIAGKYIERIPADKNASVLAAIPALYFKITGI